ncbi:hypothetical protein DFS34DRAFT_682924 [Phlyctochytrium arcticum]|nr:hypothetical protein DFS34DRAFT_682924 [Phlyctochytrium arcticum]
MDQTEDASAELDSSMDQDGSSIMGGSQAAVLESEENADSSSDETKPFASVSTFSLSHPLHTASEFIKSNIPGLGQRRQNDLPAIMRKVLIDIFSIFAREENWLYALKRTLDDKRFADRFGYSSRERFNFNNVRSHLPTIDEAPEQLQDFEQQEQEEDLFSLQKAEIDSLLVELIQRELKLQECQTQLRTLQLFKARSQSSLQQQEKASLKSNLGEKYQAKLAEAVQIGKATIDSRVSSGIAGLRANYKAKLASMTQRAKYHQDLRRKEDTSNSDDNVGIDAAIADFISLGGTGETTAMVGSTILCETEVFLGLILHIPCEKCNFVGRPETIKVEKTGYGVKFHVSCGKCAARICRRNFKRSEAKAGTERANLTTAVIVGALNAGVNRYQLVSLFNMISITQHPSESTYFKIQGTKTALSIFKKACEVSVANAAQRVLFYCQTIPLLAFVCATADGGWSHRGNAGKQHLEMNLTLRTSFSTTLNPRSRTLADGTVRSVREGNFEESSKHMEHQNLTVATFNLHQPLTDAGMKLHLTKDGDLQANQLLAREPLVEKHYADLPHWNKNVRKNWEKKYSSIWGPSWEEKICSHPRNVVYVLGELRRKEAEDLLELKRQGLKGEAPAAKDWEAIAREQLVPVFIRHLQDDHTSCMDELCWAAQTNTEIDVSLPNLVNKPTAIVEKFTLTITDLFKTLKGQCLITQDRTTMNETFHNNVTKRSSKEIDTPAVYETRYRLQYLHMSKMKE